LIDNKLFIDPGGGTEKNMRIDLPAPDPSQEKESVPTPQVIRKFHHKWIMFTVESRKNNTT
jgi:hypothetical protein